jgi:hypothetical protein
MKFALATEDRETAGKSDFRLKRIFDFGLGAQILRRVYPFNCVQGRL